MAAGLTSMEAGVLPSLRRPAAATRSSGGVPAAALRASSVGPPLRPRGCPGSGSLSPGEAGLSGRSGGGVVAPRLLPSPPSAGGVGGAGKAPARRAPLGAAEGLVRPPAAGGALASGGADGAEGLLRPKPEPGLAAGAGGRPADGTGLLDVELLPGQPSSATGWPPDDGTGLLPLGLLPPAEGRPDDGTGLLLGLLSWSPDDFLSDKFGLLLAGSWLRNWEFRFETQCGQSSGKVTVWRLTCCPSSAWRMRNTT